MSNEATLVGRLRALSHSDKLDRFEESTINEAADRIVVLEERLRQQAREHQRELREAAQDSATEAHWQDRNDRDGMPHGTY